MSVMDQVRKKGKLLTANVLVQLTNSLRFVENKLFSVKLQNRFLMVNKSGKKEWGRGVAAPGSPVQCRIILFARPQCDLLI